MKFKHFIIVGLLLVALSLVVVACGSSTTAEPTKPPPVVNTQAPAGGQTAPTQPPAPSEVVTPTVAAPAGASIGTLEVPFEKDWAASAHADVKAAAFNDWNADNPPEVPANCAKCHSTPGYQDFLGADGSAPGKVDKNAPVGTVITCVACHNSATVNLTSVTFPSGVEIKNLGPEARCMVCHQGRASKTTVDDAIKKQSLTDEDASSDKLSFVNIHYFAAAATLYGGETHGAYEYDGKSYDQKFSHVEAVDTCVTCHDNHSLKVRIDTCGTCHTNVKSEADLVNIRMLGSQVDYNGNGDIKEGISKEIEGMQAMLMQAIQAYGKEVVNKPIAYSAESYPYFFYDTNGNGQVDADEAKSDNAYKSWTPRLLKAGYNYQTSIKDPGAFAHNAKYTIQYLYDSIENLNEKITTKVDLSKAHRQDAGHFDGVAEAFRHWDEEGAVAAGCSKCHSATGLPQFLAEGANISNPVSQGLACSTCHNDLTKFTRYAVTNVSFPSGSSLSFGENNDANLCILCHQGRESTTSVNNLIKSSGAGDDEQSPKLRFLNPHYFGAGATLFGTEAKGAYEFADQKYNGRFMHVEPMSTCVNCHDVHTQAVKVEVCGGCHQGVKTEEDLKNIRQNDTVDYDGNGNATEGLGVEVDNVAQILYTSLQAYAKAKTSTAIVYSSASYPYFFVDTNGNGQLDPDEAKSENAYKAWTPNLLRAAYNYQWVNKDPGAFTHNGHYILQVLYDTIKAVGGDVSKLTRPEVVAPATPEATPTKAP